jgi:hypothetical protein
MCSVSVMILVKDWSAYPCCNRSAIWHPISICIAWCVAAGEDVVDKRNNVVYIDSTCAVCIAGFIRLRRLSTGKDVAYQMHDIINIDSTT